ncbi:MAG: hypothetical protein K5888_10405 [Lachnospiraceae bacterium]|nr:hypothetical protein [Lachnospiraceae bacterium]
MKRLFIRILIVLTTFIIATIITSRIINKDSVDMTSGMGPASIPVVTIQYNGISANRMYGYEDDMDLSYMRQSITPLMSGRKMSLVIDTYGATVLGIEYEVRTVNGSRLIEDNSISDFTVDSRQIHSDIVIKDLIENNREYEFVLKLELSGGNKYNYYTRIISPDEYHVSDKLEYVADFSSKTFNKAAAEELTMYLEPDKTGDNTTFGKVNIHSSFDQVTWGDLNPLRVTDPMITIKELSPSTGSFLVDYYVSINEDDDINYYRVREFFRVRYSNERMYLLDYERTMDDVFEDIKSSYQGNNIMLGISSGDVSLKESEDGSNIAFITGDRLYSYNTIDNKMSFVFGFYDTFTEDVRPVNNDHDIKIMNIDEAGNIVFLVYGYMNRGSHEGQVGASAYYYDNTVNTIEELAFIRSTHAPDLFIKEVEKLSYMNANGTLYLLIGDVLYGIDQASKEPRVIAEGLGEGTYVTSKNGRLVSYIPGGNKTNSTRLMLLNLDTAVKSFIDVSSNETVLPIGFMGEDLIYGVARKSDITNDRMGKTLIPMYRLNIFSELEGDLMTYERDNIYVTEGEVIDNRIALMRMKKTDEGNFVYTTNDQIVNSESMTASSSSLSEVVTEKYEKLTAISLKKEIDADTMKHLNPKMVLYEGDREVNIRSKGDSAEFIVYGKYGADSYHNAENDAVDRAYEISGIVMNNEGAYIWKKTSRSSKNQIMAIEASETSASRGSLAVCLDTMLEYEGVIRNSAYMLGQNKTVIEILEDALIDYEILDLTGCSLDMVLYYVNMDIPVLFMQEDNEAMLLVGFNETCVVLMDPLKNEIYKVDMFEATEMFEENGNCFITYIRSQEQ